MVLVTWVISCFDTTVPAEVTVSTGSRIIPSIGEFTTSGIQLKHYMYFTFSVTALIVRYTIMCTLHMFWLQVVITFQAVA